MTKAKTTNANSTKFIYTIILPNGKEVILGAYASDGVAKGAAKRKFNADYLAFCSWPIKQREYKPGEMDRAGEVWQG
jgi:hypothetical protein